MTTTKKIAALNAEVAHLMAAWNMTALEALDRIKREAHLYAPELEIRESFILAFVADQTTNVLYNGGLAV